MSREQQAQPQPRHGEYGGGYGNPYGPYPSFYPPFPSPCGEKEIPVHCVPFVIDCPGKYKVVKDLCYAGNQVAIIIRASNVDLNFHTHNLTLKDPNATGVLVVDSEEVVIRHDKIILELPQGGRCLHGDSCKSCKPCKPLPEEPGQSAAIHVRNSTKIDILDCFVENTGHGVLAQGTTDLRVVRLLAKNNFKTNIRLDDTRGTCIEKSKLTNIEPPVEGGVLVQADAGKSELFTMSKTQVYNSDIVIFTLSGGIIQNVDSLMDSDLFLFAMLQVGGFSGTRVDSLQIIDSNFKRITSENANPNSAAEGLYLIPENCHGLVVDNVVVDIESVVNPFLGGINFLGGQGGICVKNSYVRVKGRSPFGFSNPIYFEQNSQGVVLANNKFDGQEGTTSVVVLFDSSFNTFRGNTITAAPSTPLGYEFVNSSLNDLREESILRPVVGISFDETSNSNYRVNTVVRSSAAPVRDLGLKNNFAQDITNAIDVPPLANQPRNLEPKSGDAKKQSANKRMKVPVF